MDENHDERISLQEFINSASTDRSLINMLELDYDTKWRQIKEAKRKVTKCSPSKCENPLYHNLDMFLSDKNYGYFLR